MKVEHPGRKIINKGVLWAGIAGAALISLRAVQLVAAGAVLGIKKFREKQRDYQP